ncbi:hypothetical protein AYI69_g8945 [Smittium culicis]|uniref:Uncharacterized protein n=1 Tax=Smittium culicis TaxID=133412 RepID=A0A1R1XG20_9FUNG|nr:hypothetical protein AYI69_g8945 [Smittium culicis]
MNTEANNVKLQQSALFVQNLPYQLQLIDVGKFVYGLQDSCFANSSQNFGVSSTMLLSELPPRKYSNLIFSRYHFWHF